MEDPKIKRVLISVTDKSGVAEFAAALQQEFGAEIISTGGTARALSEAGVNVVPIDDVTQFPEMMDGRVKTLHPKVHGGLLAKRSNPSHMAQAAEHGIGMIDMVVVNLYAFNKTVESGADFDTCIENIDIGGPSMLRSAAKNFESVTVVTRPESYNAILEEMRANNGATTRATRIACAHDVFCITYVYDGLFAAWLGAQIAGGEAGEAGAVAAGAAACAECAAEVAAAEAAADAAESAESAFAPALNLSLTKVQDLRYGENPHQSAAFYRRDDYSMAEYSLAYAQKLQGKELSYNNYLDLDAAWSAVREFDEPACVIVKHLTPCGVCVDDDIVAAYKRAHACDPVSAYGGVMAFNRPVTSDVVVAIFENKQFVEAIIAPEFAADALSMYEEKPNARLLATGGINPAGREVEYRSVEGGLLCQDSDAVAEEPANFRVVTKRQPTEDEMAEMLFAWKVC